MNKSTQVLKVTPQKSEVRLLDNLLLSIGNVIRTNNDMPIPGIDPPFEVEMFTVARLVRDLAKFEPGSLTDPIAKTMYFSLLKDSEHEAVKEIAERINKLNRGELAILGCYMSSKKNLINDSLVWMARCL